MNLRGTEIYIFSVFPWFSFQVCILIPKSVFLLCKSSSIFSELVRTNELCRRYSDACVELCQEMGLKVIDLWTAFQRRDDWVTACFT